LGWARRRRGAVSGANVEDRIRLYIDDWRIERPAGYRRNAKNSSQTRAALMVGTVYHGEFLPSAYHRRKDSSRMSGRADSANHPAAISKVNEVVRDAEERLEHLDEIVNGAAFKGSQRG